MVHSLNVEVDMAEGCLEDSVWQGKVSVGNVMLPLSAPIRGGMLLVEITLLCRDLCFSACKGCYVAGDFYKLK